MRTVGITAPPMSRSAARGEWDPAVSSSPYTSKSDVTVHDNRDHLVLDPTRNKPYTLNHSVGTSLILHSEGNKVRDPRMGILACEVITFGQMADSRVSNCAEILYRRPKTSTSIDSCLSSLWARC